MHSGWWIFSKANSKTLHIGWRDENGKVRSRSAGTRDRAIAKQRGTKWERERYAAEADLPTYRLQDALTELIAHKKRVRRAADTLEITECKCGHLLRVLGVNFDVTTTTLETSHGYIDQRRAEGAHDNTIHKELAQLKQALRLAWRATPPKFHRDPSTMWPKEALENAYVPGETYWTLEDYRKAQQHGVRSRADHVAIYCNCGLRFAELYRLRAEHIDATLRCMWVPGTKTKGAKRFVPLNDIALEVVLRRAKLYPEGPLFPDFWQSSHLSRDMRRVAKRAHVPAVTTNDMRRTFATWCGEADVAEVTVIKWMGHTTSNMVRRIYQKLSERRAVAEGAKLTAFITQQFAATSAASGSKIGDFVENLPPAPPFNPAMGPTITRNH